MDWNNDGKHDWKDDAFYNNVIESEDKSSSFSHSGSFNYKKELKNTCDSSKSGNWWVWIIIFCVVYILIKVI